MHPISFVVPTFNRAHLLEESLDSLTREAGPEDEIIVVDDGSADRTRDLLDARSGRIRAIYQPNRGKAAALNAAIGTAGGDYVWIMDDDDLLRPGAVARMLTAIETANVDWAFGRHSRFVATAHGRRDLGTGYWPDLRTGSILRHVLEDFFPHQPGCIVRRDVYRRVGPFNEAVSRGLDYEMLIRIALNARGVAVDEVVFDQRQHDGARGPDHARHQSGERMSVWESWDRRFFTSLFEELPISIYEAMYASPDPELVSRAAHLQRACVSARHGLWHFALVDLVQAASIAGPLTPVEARICSRVLGGKYGLSGLDAHAPDGFAYLCGFSETGSEIVARALRGASWRLKQLDGNARTLATLIAALSIRSPGLVLNLSRFSTAKSAGRALLEEQAELAPAQTGSAWRWSPGD